MQEDERRALGPVVSLRPSGEAGEAGSRSGGARGSCPERGSGSRSTADPAADLVEAGVGVFRRFAAEHHSLFTIGVQRTLTSRPLAERFRPAAADALAGLTARVDRLEAADVLGPRTVRDAVWEFHALCEGLAAVELRGLMPPGREERIWRDALAALVAGFARPQSYGANPPGKPRAPVAE